MDNQLTVIIPCKDELTNLPDCIESVVGLADELLIADSGSSDGSLQYVHERGDCRVIEREYRTSGDFKNWAIPQAKHPWVLILDADERITPDLQREITQLFQQGSLEDGYWIYRNNHLMGHHVRGTCWGRDKVLRLFRRDLGRYEGPSDHGEIVISSGRVGKLRQKMDHYTFWSWSDWMRKLDRYAQLQAEQWIEEGRKPSYAKLLFQPPMRFLRDYILQLGFLDGAAGLQVSWSSAFYTFMKQARLWELHSGLKPEDVQQHQASERRAA